MSKKNFKVATDNGQTPKQDTKHIFATVNVKKDNTPTGKVKTLKDKETLKKEREEQYKNFRIGALKRRAKRMGLTEEQTKVKVEELIKQIDTPNQYLVLVMFNPDDKDMNTQALKNEGIVWKMQGSNYFYIEADQDTLGTIRSIMTPGSKIHPYVKKKPPILPVQEQSKSKVKPKTKAEKKSAAKAAKKARKAAMDIKKREGKEYMKFHKRCQKAAVKAERKAAGTTTQKKAKNVSMTSKKASTGIKKAA
ncbi:MAG: hypothetical protein VZR53_00030 [Prevotella sp.]|nr:hypothetical protein [Prevotella sp.]